jgi:hypothetical protein
MAETGFQLGVDNRGNVEMISAKGPWGYISKPMRSGLRMTTAPLGPSEASHGGSGGLAPQGKEV